jgi:CBS domain containing-hemolysin-like protein
MKNMTLVNLNDVDHLVYPEQFDEITLDSQAVSVFTDFKEHRPLVIESDISAVQAEYMMRKSHVRLKLVVDDNANLLGTISLDQLSSQNILIHQQKGFDREDILVKHLMMPRVEIKALDFKEMMTSTIADVIETLKKNGAQHCLVVESLEHEIRGIISTSDIARRLHMPLNIETNTTSFIDVFKVINK